MTILANSLVIFFITVGVLFIVVTAIGLVRLPDLYTRAHAASKVQHLASCVCLSVYSFTFG